MAQLHRGVHGDGQGLGLAGDVPRQHDGGAEFPQGPGKGEHRAGDDPRQTVGKNNPPENGGLRQAQGPPGVDEVRVHLLKGSPGRAVHQWEGHHRGGDDHPHPGEYDLDAELGQPLPDTAGLAEEHQQEEAHHRRGQHQGQGEDSVLDSHSVTHPRHLPRRVYPDKKSDDRGDARSPKR